VEVSHGTSTVSAAQHGAVPGSTARTTAVGDSPTLSRPTASDGEWNETVLRLSRSSSAGQELTESDLLRASQVRRITSAKLRLWHLEHLVDSAELVMSELVTNELRHGSGAEVMVRLWRSEAGVGLAVTGQGVCRARLRVADPWEESGRGLLLVEAVTDAWGVTPDRNGLWCLLGTTGEAT
jgi:anti-sigma regulatory factor (Ser/Thr protein kinase)